MNKNRIWWNNLNNSWKRELIENLLENQKYQRQNINKDDILHFAEESDAIIEDIENLTCVHVSEEVVDNLKPLNFLNNINDFRIKPLFYNDELLDYDIKHYPKHLREKVLFLEVKDTYLGDDLTILHDFVNLEHLVFVNCELQSLEGIQKLTKLKRVDLSQNPFTDLTPLKRLQIQKLNISRTNVRDTSPLICHPSIEWINVEGLDLDIPDNRNFFSIPKLELIVYTEYNEALFFDEILIKNNAPDPNREWWKELSTEWKIRLISNLLDTDEYKDFGIDIEGLYHLVENSNKYLPFIASLETVRINSEWLNDLAPLDNLKKLKRIEIDFDEKSKQNAHKMLAKCPCHLRPKVKVINLNKVPFSANFTLLSKFENLEKLYIGNCGFTSLTGLEKLKHLKHLAASGNYFSDLQPLASLSLELLDLQDTPVKDLSVIEKMTSLEFLNVKSIIGLINYSAIFYLPFLKLAISYEVIKTTRTSIKRQLHHEISEKLQNNNIINLNPDVVPHKLIKNSSFNKN
ncbi:leucine-rich repeat domain-containing protein [uncultured Draconibacterium sp.]|uniref:leucine-rich repeat domain-containing protein n=1 Tax=uncultured Draconibacterium sp. TaxID=1573823 RepID=UPI0025E70994|nr:leucine-rich repeat domain-containing protein [uncultured Draconibacterium sp.]